MEAFVFLRVGANSVCRQDVDLVVLGGTEGRQTRIGPNGSVGVVDSKQALRVSQYNDVRRFFIPYRQEPAAFWERLRVAVLLRRFMNSFTLYVLATIL